MHEANNLTAIFTLLSIYQRYVLYKFKINPYEIDLKTETTKLF